MLAAGISGLVALALGRGRWIPVSALVMAQRGLRYGPWPASPCLRSTCRIAVPLRTRRSVPASTETAIAFHRGDYQATVPRIKASLEAAYATDWTALDTTLAPYGVDVVLNSAAVFRKPACFAPFDALVRQLTDGVNPDAFVLRDPPADRVLFRSGAWWL